MGIFVVLEVMGEGGAAGICAPTVPGSGTEVAMLVAPGIGCGELEDISGPATFTEQLYMVMEKIITNDRATIFISEIYWGGRLCKKSSASCTVAILITLMVLATETASA